MDHPDQRRESSRSVLIKKPFRIDLFGNWSDNEAFLPHIPSSRVINCTYRFKCMEAPISLAVHWTDGERFTYASEDLGIVKEISFRDLVHNPLLRVYAEFFCVHDETEFREALAKHRGIDLCTISHLPFRSGLGTSASLIVAFYEALSILSGTGETKYDIAEKSYRIERKSYVCGWQDHYSSVFKGPLLVERDAYCIYPTLRRLSSDPFSLIEDHGFLVYLSEKPHEDIDSNWQVTDKIVSLVSEMDKLVDAFLEMGSNYEIGHLIAILRENVSITYSYFPEEYRRALERIMTVIPCQEKVGCIVGSGPAALILTDLQKHEAAEEVERTVGISTKELRLVESEVEL